MLHLLFIFPISHRCAVLHKAPGGWAVNYWRGRPFVLANKREPFQDNRWHRPTPPFNDGLPAGPCRRCKCVRVYFFLPSLPLVGVVVVNSVCWQTTPGGLERSFCGPRSRCGLETMGILGGTDAMLQLLDQRTELSKNTATFSLVTERKQTSGPVEDPEMP